MTTDKLLGKIKSVQIIKPADHIIQQFRNLLQTNAIKPGDILPSERELAKSFGVGRGYVREAIKTLELYGVFKATPWVGTVVSDLGIQCINNFINNVVQFSIHDYIELIEVRGLIEPFTAFRAATNATDDELAAIGKIYTELSQFVSRDEVSRQLECDFHMEIAKASHNSLLANTISAILPGLLRLIDELDLTRGGRLAIAHEEHGKLYEALVARDPAAAEQAMRHHMERTGAHFSVRIDEIEVKRASQRMFPKK